MSLSPSALMPARGVRYPRIFTVKRMDALPNNIRLRFDLSEAASRLNIGKPEVLSRFGISEHGINIIKLSSALSPRGDKLNIPDGLKLRQGEPRTLENAVRAVLGRVGEDSVFDPTDIHTILSSGGLNFEEKLAVVVSYLKYCEFTDPEVAADLVAAFSERAFRKNAAQKEEFLVRLARELYKDGSDDKISFMLAAKAAIKTD